MFEMVNAQRSSAESVGASARCRLEDERLAARETCVAGQRYGAISLTEPKLPMYFAAVLHTLPLLTLTSAARSSGLSVTR